MSNKKIIITGALGQDGKILSKLLIKKGFKVYGFINFIIQKERKILKKNTKLIFPLPDIDII